MAVLAVRLAKAGRNVGLPVDRVHHVADLLVELVRAVGDVVAVLELVEPDALQQVDRLLRVVAIPLSQGLVEHRMVQGIQPHHVAVHVRDALEPAVVVVTAQAQLARELARLGNGEVHRLDPYVVPAGAPVDLDGVPHGPEGRASPILHLVRVLSLARHRQKYGDREPHDDAHSMQAASEAHVHDPIANIADDTLLH